MFNFKEKKIKIEPSETGKIDYSTVSLVEDLQKNIELIDQIFIDDETLVKREFICLSPQKLNCCIFFIDGMVSSEIINDNILKPIMTNNKEKSDMNIIDMIKPMITNNKEKNDVNIIDIISEEILFSNEVTKTTDIEKIVESIAYGDTLLLVEGCSSALIINSKGWQIRSIVEPEAEKVLRGPREGFTEGILINLSLIRRKLNTSDLKMKFSNLGTRSNTKICICYLDSLVDKKVLDELYKRLESIEMDAILDSNYIAEQIKDAKYSPFKTIGITERPDTLAAKLLEGRIGLLVDGTPTVITLPYLFIENFQASDDYYLNFYFATLGRMLRIVGFILSCSIPAIYISLTSFHREMIPTRLALSIAEARQGVPFPTVVECLMVLFGFEIIRETGIRMPSAIGQALSVVGALVVGQAAVDAKFVSAPMVIIIAVTAITGLINTKTKSATLVLGILFLLASTILGFYGYFFAVMLLLIHIFSLESFGVEYTSQITSLDLQGAKDIMIRAPWWKMKTRPNHLTNNKKRSK